MGHNMQAKIGERWTPRDTRRSLKEMLIKMGTSLEINDSHHWKKIKISKTTIKSAISAYAMTTGRAIWARSPLPKTCFSRQQHNRDKAYHLREMGQASIITTATTRKSGTSRRSIILSRWRRPSEMKSRSSSRGYMGIFQCSISRVSLMIMLILCSWEAGCQGCQLVRAQWLNSKVATMTIDEILQCWSVKTASTSSMCKRRRNSITQTQKMPNLPVSLVPLLEIAKHRHQITTHKPQNCNKINQTIAARLTKPE